MKSSLMFGKSPLSSRGIALVLALAILIPTAPREAFARGGVFHLLSGAQGSDRHFFTDGSSDRNPHTDCFRQLWRTTDPRSEFPSMSRPCRFWKLKLAAE
jgi:hypothetical protein